MKDLIFNDPTILDVCCSSFIVYSANGFIDIVSIQYKYAILLKIIHKIKNNSILYILYSLYNLVRLLLLLVDSSGGHYLLKLLVVFFLNIMI